MDSRTPFQELWYKVYNCDRYLIAGKVLSIKVNVGDTVKKGQVVAVIEAMKLENEIPASADGIVKEICVSVGASVNNKDKLIILG